MLLIGRIPALVSRSCSQRGEGPICHILDQERRIAVTQIGIADL